MRAGDCIVVVLPGKIEGRWKPIMPMTVTLRGTYVRAITTASPDLPEEVGRELTRFPPYNLSASMSYGFSSGRLRGLSLSGSWSYISDFVASYEDGTLAECLRKDEFVWNARPRFANRDDGEARFPKQCNQNGRNVLVRDERGHYCPLANG